MKTLSIYKIALLGSMIIGITACGSSQAPWSKPDDSPWSEKHASIAESAPADDIVFEPAMTESAMAEPAPMDSMSEPMPVEPSRFEEPAPVMVEPAAVEPEPVMTDMSPEDKILSMPEGSYAVQIYASTTASSMARYQTQKDLLELDVLKTERDGTIYFVLVDLHESRAAASDAAIDLEQKSGAKVWVRSVKGLQDIVVK